MCRIVEKVKKLICISLPNKRYYCLIPRSIECFSQFSAIPHLTLKRVEDGEFEIKINHP